MKHTSSRWIDSATGAVILDGFVVALICFDTNRFDGRTSFQAWIIVPVSTFCP